MPRRSVSDERDRALLSPTGAAGGFNKPDETLDAAARRELFEETNVKAPGHLSQFRSYGDPGRDPRGNVVTVAYLAAVRPLVGAVGGSDAVHAAVVPVAEAVSRKRRLALDHRHIVLDAVEHVRGQPERTDVAMAFLPPMFTLSDLRTVHEAIIGTTLDPPNFRRRVLGADRPLAEPTGEYGHSGSGGGPPAELFRRTR